MYWTDVKKMTLMQLNVDGFGKMTLLSIGLTVPDIMC